MAYHDKDSLSQNFIKHPNLVAELLNESGLVRSDTVIEIGPGKGIITNQLAKRVTNVIGIELDAKLYRDLVEKFKNDSGVKLINQDFLDYPLPYLPYKIVANIPFSITAKVVNKVLKADNMAETMHLIMQREAAEKYLGAPYETQSSVLTKPWYEVEILGEIDRTNFTLKPQVSIVYVQFKKRPMPFIRNEDKFEFRDFVVYGFNQWQPTIMDNYKKVLTHTQRLTIKKTLKIGDVSPGELSFDTWLHFFKTYQKVATETQKDEVRAYRKHYNAQL